MPVGKPEFTENPEPRCPVILLLDNSGSMSGEPIQQLNQGLIAFKESVEQDGLASLRVEVAIISFGPVKLVQNFVTINQFLPPILQPEGPTPMGEAIEYALDLLENRKEDYKNNGISYYRPWLFLITDGTPYPEPPSVWQNAAQRVRNAEANRKVSFFAVGVQDADMNILSQIAPPDRPPLLLNGLDFKSMFVWLSQSVTNVSLSTPDIKMVETSPVGWGKIPTNLS